jgi:putative salt-induced outer membrane protein YdiY
MRRFFYFALFATLFLYADEVKLTDVEGKYKAYHKLEVEHQFKQHIGFGFANTTGNSETLNFSFDYNFEYITAGYSNQELKLLFDTRAYISESNHEKDDEEYKAWLRCEQMIVDNWFGYLSSRWERNRFQNYENKTTLGIGLGKDLLSDSNQSLTLTLGVAYTFEYYSDDTPHYNYSSITQYLDYKNQLNEISNLYLKLGAMESFEHFRDDYELVMLAGVKFIIAQSLNLSIESEVDYDASVADGYEKTDTKTLIKLGYDF